MSPEDFTNPNHNNHPEVSDATLEMERPEQVTLRHLLHEITDKTEDGNDRYGIIGADLVRPGEMRCVATVYRIEKGISKDNPNRVGQIHRMENVGENGDQVITNYFILDTPDGLQMEKHGQTSNRKEMLDDSATIEDVFHSALSGMARIVELQKAHAEEDELGLSFVSEQEARDLLKLLDGLKPTK